MMATRKSVRHVLAAAALVVPLATPAFGQFAVDRSGAHDANPRVGSGGRNEVSNNPKPWETANAIVEGTITGGKSFRGGSQSSDPRAFRGFTAGAPSSNLVRDSAGVTPSGLASYNANRDISYFGDNLAINAPQGFRPIGSTGAYVPPRPTADTYTPFDTRIKPVSGVVGVLPNRLGDTNFPGQVDNGAIDPLSGFTADNDPRLDPLSSLSVSSYTNLNRNANYDPRTLQRIGNDVRGQQNNALVDPNAPTAARDNSVDNAVDNAANNDPLGNTVGKPATQLEAPELQSAMYDTLRKQRMTRDSANTPGTLNLPTAGNPNKSAVPTGPGKEDGKTDPPIPNDVKDGAARDLTNGVDANPAAPDRSAAPAGPAVTGPELPKAISGEPVKVTSLAAGVKSKDLADLLTSAEKQLREGQYISAIDTYDAAERVVPNNPLIRLGRAHAELGASYYMRAERSLRQTIGKDKNLLMGQYDLRTFLGEDRLTFLDAELKELVRTDDKNSSAAFLLAYLYYNTGSEARAKAFLSLAEGRAKDDTFLKDVRSAWFPAGSEQTK